MRVPDEVRQCVVFIGSPIKMADGKVGLDFKGTAFFVGIKSEKIEGVNYVYLISNTSSL